jgi:gamma-glutamylcyclotransferase (GGCT)/AIG2-like uncharacterized protein YtfP
LIRVTERNESPKEGDLNRVFVYGTLRDREPNHYILAEAGAKVIGYTRITGYIMLHLGAYPGVVKAPPTGGWQIFGEVYDVDDATLLRMDQLEGHPNFYTRIEVDLPAPFGKAWMYALPANKYLQSGVQFIPFGRWDGRKTTAFLWDEARVLQPYQSTRPLIQAPTPKEDPKGVIVPERAPEKPSEKPLQVGPGWEEMSQ